MRALCWLPWWYLLLRTVLVRTGLEETVENCVVAQGWPSDQLAVVLEPWRVRFRAGALGVVGGKPWYQMTGRLGGWKLREPCKWLS